MHVACEDSRLAALPRVNCFLAELETRISCLCAGQAHLTLGPAMVMLSHLLEALNCQARSTLGSTRLRRLSFARCWWDCIPAAPATSRRRAKEKRESKNASRLRTTPYTAIPQRGWRGAMSAYDVVVVGGGPAGLSAALLLARCLRTVAVVDAGRPRNAVSKQVGGFLTRDGVAPTELLDLARKEVAAYGVDLTRGEVVDVKRRDVPRLHFLVTLANGDVLSCRRVLVATGAVDELPPIRGLAPLWGTCVLHCPFCHGYEHRGESIGVLCTSTMSVQQALLFRQLSDDVVFFAHTGPALDARNVRRLRGRGIAIVEGEVVALECSVRETSSFVAVSRADRLLLQEEKLARIRLADGRSVERQVLAVSVRTRPQAEFVKSLGIAPVDHGAEEKASCLIGSDELGRCDVPGLWFAGNCTDTVGRVPAAVSEGAVAAAHINTDLVNEDADAAEQQETEHLADKHAPLVDGMDHRLP
jgi:thioredoxin reductase